MPLFTVTMKLNGVAGEEKDAISHAIKRMVKLFMVNPE
jgi:hypothetical protein